jgi:hypothetical protein
MWNFCAPQANPFEVYSSAPGAFLSCVHFKLSVFAKVRNNDVLMESFSDEEEEEISNGGPGDEAPSEVRELLCRKVELERTQRRQELHKQRVKVIARAAIVKISN